MRRVSVIIPVFNHEKYIAECVESVLGQTYRDFEVVVVDDGSTDRTPEILKRYGDRIRYIRQSNRGGAGALNTAIRNSRGEYIAWLSSDDVFLPAKLEEQVAHFEQHPEVDVTYTDFLVIDGEGKVTGEVRSPYYPDKKRFRYEMFVGNFVNGSSVMFRRKCIEETGYFDEEMRYHADGNMWFRMLKRHEFGHIPIPLLKYRWHDTNISHHFRGMRKYLDLYYRKILKAYPCEEIFPDGGEPGEANLALGSILLRHHRLYSLGFSLLCEGIKRNPFKARGYRLMLSFSTRMPWYLISDVYSWRLSTRKRT